ncbi:MAG: leucine-rich repeat protein [Faecousia sp.]
MYCGKCGMPIPDDAMFCGACGCAVLRQENDACFIEPSTDMSETPQKRGQKRKWSIAVCAIAVCCIVVVCALLLSDPKASPIEDFEYKFVEGNAVITKYIGSDLEVVIPDEIEGRPVTTIGEDAFHGYDFESVYIPDSVLVIESLAFSECTRLKEVRLPKNLKNLGGFAFSACGSLEEIEIYSAEKIGGFAFRGCSALKEVELPDNLKSLGDAAFASCSALKQIELPDNLKSIGSAVFSGTAIKELMLPDNVTEFSRSEVTIFDPSNLYTGDVRLKTILEPIDSFADKNVIIYVNKGSATQRTLDNYDRTVDEVIAKYGVVYDSGVTMNGVDIKLYFEDYRFHYQIVD